MTDLSPRARAVIEEASSSDGPSDADRDRIRDKLVARLGVAALAGGSTVVAGTAANAATSSAAASASAGASGAPAGVAGAAAGTAATNSTIATGGGIGTGLSVGVAAKVAAATAIVGAVAIGATVTPWDRLTGIPDQHGKSVRKQVTSKVAPRAPDEQAVESSVPEATTTETAAPEATAEETAAPEPPAEQEPAHGAALSGSSTPRIRKARPADGRAELQKEVALLRSAQRWLRQNEPAQALEILGLHSYWYPNGLLRQERRAARAIALCQLGRIKEGRKEAKLLLAESPRSPLWPRVRRSCSGPRP